MGVEKDVPPGEELVACFRPFIEHLASSSLSSKTIRRHVDNLWLLGGEIIRDLNYDPSLRKLPADRLLSKAIHEDGGPLLYSGSEEEQRSFDATCRKLHRFRSQPSALRHPVTHKFSGRSRFYISLRISSGYSRNPCPRPSLGFLASTGFRGTALQSSTP